MKNRLYLLLLLIFSPSILAHLDSAYYRNATDGFTTKSKWMDTLRDDVMLSEIALPGTHDSAAYKNFVDSVSTQTLNFDQQLEYGIRVFDIRIRHTNNAFALHHGNVFLDVMFGDFMNSIDTFLSKNPSETVLFRLKKEIESDDSNTRAISKTLEYYIELHKDKYFDLQSMSTKLGDIRGRYMILSNSDAFHNYGLYYGLTDTQDEFHLTTNWDLYSKWEIIKNQLERATNGNKNKIYINYLSGSGGSFPYFVASGHSSPGTSAPRLSTGLTTPGWKDSYPDFPRTSCAGICTISFEGTNILTRDKLKYYNDLNTKRTVGIIMADFPGESLITHVIDNNKNLRK
ncbi:TPA: phosphatidylinositol-specific phospholipase C [Providencia rettgeri]|uniref:phosphatidylinositol-specific phospholipase C n=1 Tax=Providencia TaxID=586 RepID=UPI001B8DEE0A|nr:MULTISPECIES: phosphatidylinositol-specific phospholipase C [Providencia]EMB5786886.1 phosphatidylinositol-specific phospholipase C [Providencia rettgeri]MDK7745424.1 phosphatidylinositol-specific phospholipase C [Providencia rettgeri]MDK7757902.1 phosphatidylinositol-specific phospholipase C [Providencia rettgeri]HBC7428433.1 phosphatidylinositol-specific phospholipase C [Providencia rettgeri]